MKFHKVLIDWYSINKRFLPWRQSHNPYFIWLSEIMLQQTQVNQGLPYYEKFVKAYPTVFDLAAAPEEEVLKNWQGLGYYSRARNLHATAKYIAYDLQGKFPSTYESLIKLKGVGDYTASAIASIAFNEPKAVLDGNVFRVLSRYFGVSEPINSAPGLKQFKTLSQALIYAEDPGTYNQALMEFGALQCKPKKPDCGTCVLSASCVAKKDNLIQKLPVKLKKTKIQHRYFNYLVCVDPRGCTKIEQRKTRGIWQNLYQFPLVESEKSQEFSAFKGLLAQSQFSIDAVSEYFLFKTEDIIHRLSHRTIHAKFWIVLLNTPLDHGIHHSQITAYPVPVLLDNFIKEFDFEQVYT